MVNELLFEKPVSWLMHMVYRMAQHVHHLQFNPYIITIFTRLLAISNDYFTKELGAWAKSG